MPRLRPGPEKFFTFIHARNAGDVVTDSDIIAATGWERATVETHRNKNAFDPFLLPTGAGTYRVKQPGSSVSREQVNKAFTQIRPTEFVLTEGTKIKASGRDYLLINELGRGAVAHVWRVQAVLGRSQFAAKIMHPRADLLNPDTFEDVKRRFSRESRNGKKVKHTHIVPYVDYGDLGGHPFLIMDIADESLADILKARALEVHETLDVIRGCIAGLQHLESMDCVHRDIKPQNILRFGDRFVLGDLGIVNWSDMNPAFTSAGTITRSSIQLGSWFYMAPEQLKAPHQSNISGDVYALGVSWLEMLTGSTSNPAEIAAAAFAAPCGDEKINNVIGRMLSYQTASRPSLVEILTVIDSI